MKKLTVIVLLIAMVSFASAQTLKQWETIVSTPQTYEAPQQTTYSHYSDYSTLYKSSTSTKIEDPGKFVVTSFVVGQDVGDNIRHYPVKTDDGIKWFSVYEVDGTRVVIQNEIFYPSDTQITKTYYAIKNSLKNK